MHHLKAFAPDSRNTIALVGYQAAGTRGAALAAHASAIRIHGGSVPVRASVVTLSSLSAHADCRELTDWRCEIPSCLESVELPGFVVNATVDPCAATAIPDSETADPDQLARRPEVT